MHICLRFMCRRKYKLAVIAQIFFSHFIPANINHNSISAHPTLGLSILLQLYFQSLPSSLQRTLEYLLEFMPMSFLLSNYVLVELNHKSGKLVIQFLIYTLGKKLTDINQCLTDPANRWLTNVKPILTRTISYY